MHKILKRTVREKIEKYLKIFPVVAILGPRQCGKSTLVKSLLQEIDDSKYFDLESYEDLNKIIVDPLAFFRSSKGQVICLDEIQKLPEIFTVMRGVIDENRENGRFFVLGSASTKLLKQTAESLAGRIGYIELTPFTFLEVEIEDILSHWIRGGFPESYLASSDEQSFFWRQNFVKSIVERDMQEFKQSSPLRIFKLFQLLVHYHGQTLNYEKISAHLDVTGRTVKEYIDILESMYFVRRLPQFHKNVKKRLIKSPKVYIRDSGLLHSLARIKNEAELKLHPVYGFSFEGYVVENLLTIFPDATASYYRTSNNEEIDLILEQGGKVVAIEVKASKEPSLSSKSKSALKTVQPDYTFIIVPSYAKLYTVKSEFGHFTIGDIYQVVAGVKDIFQSTVSK